MALLFIANGSSEMDIELYEILGVGKDLIGLAQTGSGKTGAFAIPILQALIEAPQAFFACVLSPTRFVICLMYMFYLNMKC